MQAAFHCLRTRTLDRDNKVGPKINSCMGGWVGGGVARMYEKNITRQKDNRTKQNKDEWNE